MTNPFDTPDGRFHVVTNSEGQHALWPAFSPVPAGWSTVLVADTRERCLAYVDAHWTDMRPASLVRATDDDAQREPAA